MFPHISQVTVTSHVALDYNMTQMCQPLSTYFLIPGVLHIFSSEQGVEISAACRKQIRVAITRKLVKLVKGLGKDRDACTIPLMFQTLIDPSLDAVMMPSESHVKHSHVTALCN
jgi:hypothetical protein